MPDEIEIIIDDDDGLPVSIGGDDDDGLPASVGDVDVGLPPSIGGDEDAVLEFPGLDEKPVEDKPTEDQTHPLRKELDELRERYLRKLAEFDNFRKRTEREKVELERTGGEAVVRELIPVLDNFERALQHAPGAELDAFHQGVEMIFKQLWETLQRQGMERLDPNGQFFEPEYHEAVQRIEDSGKEPGTVVSVLAKGYLFGGKLVRPALVAVAVTPPEPEGDVGPADESVEGEGAP